MEDVEDQEGPEEKAESVLFNLADSVQGEILFELGHRIDAVSLDLDLMRRRAGLNERVDATIARQAALLEGWQKTWSLVNAVMDESLLLMPYRLAASLAWFTRMTAEGVEVCAATKYMLQKTHEVCLSAKPYDEGEVETPAENDFENCARALTDLGSWERLDEMLEHGWTEEHLEQIRKERVE